MLGGPELLVIVFVVLILFGGKKLPELMRGLGKGVSEFKKATSSFEQEVKEIKDEVQKADPTKNLKA
ncbi:MAG: twin-arginine translocase TatA/TatE family subunit [Bacteroidales bacterium]|nr:twin-arginine translocase TatA/TatE family subunit [Bacteroidales bacterium]